MATVEGRRGGIEGRPRSRDRMVEVIEPSAAWTFDAENHYLLVDLPEFKKEEVRLEVDDTNQIAVSGERLVKDKYLFFEKTFKVPENANMDNITGKFDGEILYVTVPKQVPDKTQEITRVREDVPQPNSSSREGIRSGRTGDDNYREQLDVFDRETLRRWASEITPLGRAIEVIKKNKAILITALVAFSIGVLVARRIDHSRGHLGQGN